VTPSYVAVSSIHLQVNYSPRSGRYQLVVIRDDGEATEHFFTGPIDADQGLLDFATDVLDGCIYGSASRVLAQAKGLTSL
jgi:hypothetical protein